MEIMDKNICHECLGDEFLKTQILSTGKRGYCDYCNRKNRKVKGFLWFTESVHQAIEQHYHITPNEPTSVEDAISKDPETDYYWDRRGDSVDFIIQEIAEVDEPIALDVKQYLSDEYGPYPDEYWDEDPYGDDVQYESSRAEDQRFRFSWDYFRNEVSSKSRFFSHSAEEILNELFGGINSLKTLEGVPVVRDIGPTSNDRFWYRARFSQNNFIIEQILKDPVTQLGAPDSSIAKSGRMNAYGISVFYGSSHPDTCLAEIRPPVGSNVVLGKFEIIRDIRLLDFDLLTKIDVSGSLFDPKFIEQLEKAEFLKKLIGELIKPVMPNDEPFEYLPTQVIAEFLSEKISPSIDGVIYESSQTSIGKNVVLFNHSCKTEPYELPKGVTISVDLGWATEDDYDDSITVFEKHPKKSPKPSGGKQNSKKFTPIFDSDVDAFYDNSYDSRQKTLRLDVDNIEVMIIKEVNFFRKKRFLSRHKVDRIT